MLACERAEGQAHCQGVQAGERDHPLCLHCLDALKQCAHRDSPHSDVVRFVQILARRFVSWKIQVDLRGIISRSRQPRQTDQCL